MFASQSYKSIRYFGVSACCCLLPCRLRDAVFANGRGGVSLAGWSTPFRAASIWHASSVLAGSALLSGLHLALKPLCLTARLTRYPSLLAAHVLTFFTLNPHSLCFCTPLLAGLLTHSIIHLSSRSHNHSFIHSSLTPRHGCDAKPDLHQTQYDSQAGSMALMGYVLHQKSRLELVWSMFFIKHRLATMLYVMRNKLCTRSWSAEAQVATITCITCSFSECANEGSCDAELVLQQARHDCKPAEVRRFGGRLCRYGWLCLCRGEAVLQAGLQAEEEEAAPQAGSTGTLLSDLSQSCILWLTSCTALHQRPNPQW